MKTTIDVPDELYRAANAEASLRGITFDALVAEGLRLALEAVSRRRSAALKRACGIVDSGIPDLASNPEHMEGFGKWRDDD